MLWNLSSWQFAKHKLPKAPSAMQQSHWYHPKIPGLQNYYVHTQCYLLESSFGLVTALLHHQRVAAATKFCSFSPTWYAHRNSYSYWWDSVTTWFNFETSVRTLTTARSKAVRRALFYFEMQSFFTYNTTGNNIHHAVIPFFHDGYQNNLINCSQRQKESKVRILVLISSDLNINRDRKGQQKSYSSSKIHHWTFTSAVK